MASTASPKVATAAGSNSRPSGAPSVQEFSIRVPKSGKKKFQVMRFNANLGVDFNEWKISGTQIKMERENNLKEFKGQDEEIPKFGAGSEFGKEAREEARRKKFGITAKKYKPEAQPWILKTGGKSGKKFKGIREGGVSDNTAYYVFTQAGKGIIEAYPLQEWYKFQPIQRYKALSAEEAEEEFGRRNKIINYFSVMMKKRLRNDEDGDPEELEEGIKGKGKKGGKKKDKSELKISEMDDWVDSDEDNSGSDSDGNKKKDSGDEDDAATKKKKDKAKGKAAAKKKKKKDSDDEAFEESDDGDEEGREMDYISDSSESASDNEMKANKELKGVAEEDALRKLLNSESEDEDENEEKKKENESNSDDEDKKKDGDKEKDKAKEDGAKKSKKKKDAKSKKGKPEKKGSNGKAAAGGEGESSSELSPNSSDTDSDAPTDKVKTPKQKDPANSAGSSRSTSPAPVTGEKRKLTNAESVVVATKKAKLEASATTSTYIPPSSETGVTEDAVRRYLMRKPMTTKELVHKFKSKKTNLTSEQLVNLMTQILKNINPVKQTIKNRLYLSLKPT